MVKKYFQKKGFEGLTNRSKLICIGVFIVVALIGWFVFNSGKVQFWGIIKTAGLAFIIVWIVQLFLPRDTYYYTEYYCADCGNFLGYSGKVCPRCGCNRYTTQDTGVGRTIRNR